jgi:hypothetical protein
MNRSRFFLFGLGLVLLSAVGAGVYLYQNFTELLRQQAEHYLQQYGVDKFEFEGLRVAHTDASVDTLMLRGEYENFAYQLRLTWGEARYNWRTLFTGKVNSLLLTSLDISVAQTGPGASQNTGVINVEQVLPRHLIEQLPLQSLAIAHWTIDYRSANGQNIVANGALQFDQHLDVQLSTTLAGRELLAALRSDLNDENLNLDLALRENESNIATVSASLTRATSGDQTWKWNLQGQAQHTPLLLWLRELDAERELALGMPAASAFALQGDSQFTASIHHPNELNPAAPPDSDEGLLRQLTARFHLTNEIRQLDIRESADQIYGTLNLAGTLQKGRIEMTLQPFTAQGNLSTQQLSLPENWRQWMHWEDTVPVHLETTDAISFASSNSASWSVHMPTASLSLGDKDTRVSMQKLTIDVVALDAGQMEISTRLSASLSTRLRKQALPQLEIAFTQQGNLERSAFSLIVADTAESMHTALQGDIHLASGSGEYQLDAKISDLPYFTETVTPLLEHFKLLEDTVTIRSGAIHLDTTFKSRSFDIAEWEQRSQLTVENVTGGINDYSFEGLALSADWSGTTRWKTLQPLDISLAKLNIGLQVTDIHLRASLPKTTAIALPQVRVETLTATLLGGQLTLPEAQAWDFAASSNHVTIKAQQWQLSELVALQSGADIQARGTLEGELPLTVEDGRIIIENGYLRSLPPGGSIGYQANEKSLAMAKSSAELALALDLLSDFHYQVLSSEVQLDKAGNLLLGLSLEGSNPQQYQGQLINFNINVEQNIDPLLQSLRLSDNLVKRVESGLK